MAVAPPSSLPRRPGWRDRLRAWRAGRRVELLGVLLGALAGTLASVGLALPATA